MAKDFVCGMTGDFKITAQYKGNTYYFCNISCKKKFEERPEMFVK